MSGKVKSTLISLAIVFTIIMIPTAVFASYFYFTLKDTTEVEVTGVVQYTESRLHRVSKHHRERRWYTTITDDVYGYTSDYWFDTEPRIGQKFTLIYFVSEDGKVKQARLKPQ